MKNTHIHATLYPHTACVDCVDPETRNASSEKKGTSHSDKEPDA